MRRIGCLIVIVIVLLSCSSSATLASSWRVEAVTSADLAPRVLVGLASWYDAGPGIYAAMPGYRDGTRVWVTVSRGSLSVRVRVVTQCGCYRHRSDARIIDLSPSAFRRLAPLSRGLIVVRVER